MLIYWNHKNFLKENRFGNFKRESLKLLPTRYKKHRAFVLTPKLCIFTKSAKHKPKRYFLSIALRLLYKPQAIKTKKRSIKNTFK